MCGTPLLVTFHPLVMCVFVSLLRGVDVRVAVRRGGATIAKDALHGRRPRRRRARARRDASNGGGERRQRRAPGDRRARRVGFPRRHAQGRAAGTAGGDGQHGHQEGGGTVSGAGGHVHVGPQNRARRRLGSNSSTDDSVSSHAVERQERARDKGQYRRKCLRQWHTSPASTGGSSRSATGKHTCTHLVSYVLVHTCAC